MKKIAILQSNYIPWKGYFDLIASVDEFIIYDDMQFTKNDWRNRNKIKTPKGLEWLSIPVGADISKKICEVTLPNNGWQKKHLRSFELNYRKSAYFKEIIDLLTPIYINENIKTLSEFNKYLIELVCNYFDIKTKLSYSWNFKLIDGKSERLVNLCQQTNACIYVSGSAAKDYLNQQIFIDSNIKIQWFDYLGYKEYPQLWGAFEHGVTILDLMFNCGKDGSKFMKFSKGT